MDLMSAYGQLITQTANGSEFAYFATDDLRFVIGGFSDDYDGHFAEGGRDLFLEVRSDGRIDIWSGPGVEQFLPVKNTDGKDPYLLIRYFGRLETRHDHLVTSNVGNAYVIANLLEEDPFLFNLELSEGQVQCAEQSGDSLFLLVKSAGSIEINDSLVWQSSSEELVLIRMGHDSAFSAEGLISSSGDYTISDMKIAQNNLFMVGSFLGPVRIGEENIAPPTPYFDGFFTIWNLEEQALSDLLTASGVFDVRLNRVLLTENDTILLGEYFGNVELENELLEDVRLNNSLFLYSYRNEKLLNVGGAMDEQAINLHLVNDDGIMVTGNYEGKFEFGELEPDCPGNACGFYLQLDENLGFVDFQNFFSTGRTDVFNSYVFVEGLFCGSFEGNYRDTGLMSFGEDWFCERINLTTATEEKDYDNNFILYPNPIASETLYIKPTWPDGHYALFDAGGQLRKEGEWTGQLPVHDLPQGMYFLRLYNENASKLLTFSKVK